MSDEIKPDIWQLQAHFDIQGLVKALSSDDANIRRRAAAALRAIGATEALVPLRAAFAAEEDPQTRLIIATTIEMLTSDPAAQTPDTERPPTEPAMQEAMVKRLIEKLKMGKPDEIVEVAHRLGELGNKIAVEPLVLVFNDPRQSIQVRLAVAEALLKLESAPVEVALLANLRHADWHIRRNGAAILGQLRAEWAVQPLARALRDPHPIVRRTARAALKYIGTPESRKALAQISAESTRRANAATESVEGLEIKIPGQHDTEPRSGMLSKHLTHDAQRGGTKPLDSKIGDMVPPARNKSHDPTIPIPPKAAIDQMLAELASEESDKTVPQKGDTSEFRAITDEQENKPE